MKMISVVYDSKYGSNKQIAEAIVEHLQKIEDLKTNLIHVKDVNLNWKNLNNSDGIIFGSPTFLGSVSAEFKRFMENSSFFFSEQKWKNKFAAGFTCSGAASGDKLGTLLQMFIFASQHCMHWISMGLGNAGDVHDEDSPANINRLGCWIGATAQVKTNASKFDKVPVADLKTAQYLGQRMYEILIEQQKEADIKA